MTTDEKYEKKQPKPLLVFVEFVVVLSTFDVHESFILIFDAEKRLSFLSSMAFWAAAMRSIG